MTEFTLRPYEPGDEHAIVVAFNDVFRAVNGPGYVDRSLQTWNWLFRDNPAGHRIHLALTDDGTVAAQYAALPVRAHAPGGETVFCQIVDSFVRPEFRAGLKRPGLFIHTARAGLADWIARGDGLFWGLPVPQAKRISVRFLDYLEWRPLDYLCRDAGAGHDESTGRVEVSPVDDVPPGLEDLVARAASAHAVTQVRDASFLRWRYVQGPDGGYELYAARRGAELVGFLALRPAHELVPRACTLADWIVPAGEEEVADALLAVATARARAEDRACLMAVVPPDSEACRVFLARGFEVVPSARTTYRSIGVRATRSDLRPEALERGWWYTLGDTDLV